MGIIKVMSTGRFQADSQTATVIGHGYLFVLLRRLTCWQHPTFSYSHVDFQPSSLTTMYVSRWSQSRLKNMQLMILSVCASDTDLTVCSSDGVFFKVHLKNLGTHSGVFAGAGDATRPENGDEPVELSETADVLDLLFQFMYPQPQPDLRNLDFTVLAALAEAAEKYMVYPALAPCRLQMKCVLVSVETLLIS
jgi:hypothetical protein